MKIRPFNVSDPKPQVEPALDLTLIECRLDLGFWVGNVKRSYFHQLVLSRKQPSASKYTSSFHNSHGHCPIDMFHQLTSTRYPSCRDGGCWDDGWGRLRRPGAL